MPEAARHHAHGAARWLAGMALGLALLLAGAATAREAPPLVQDEALEARVMAIAQELRCLVCQNETLAASHADLAVDLRQQIRNQLQEGRSPEQIRQFMVDRYGDFVLYRPRFGARTLLLWLGPFLLLLIGLAGLLHTIRRRAGEPAAPALSAEESARARQLLGTTGETPP